MRSIAQARTFHKKTGGSFLHTVGVNFCLQLSLKKPSRPSLLKNARFDMRVSDFESRVLAHLSNKDTVCPCNRQIVGQPRERECRQNVRKISEKCPKSSRGTANTIFGHFLGIFGLFGRCFVWRRRPMLARYKSAQQPRILGWRFCQDAIFLLTVGNFLLTIELPCLQLCFSFFAYSWTFLLTIGALFL